MKIVIGERLAQTGKILDVLICHASAAPGFGIDHVGCVGAAAKINLVFIKRHFILTIRTGNHHLSGYCRPRFIDHIVGYFHKVALLIHPFHNSASGMNNLVIFYDRVSFIYYAVLRILKFQKLS